MMMSPFPFSRFVRTEFLCALIGFVFWATELKVGGQDQPDAAATVLNYPELSSGTPEGNQVIIRAVRDLDPKTGVELTKALSTMFDLDEYTFARYYLGRLEALKLTDEQRFEIYDSVGSGFLFSLHSSEALQPEGRAFAKEVLAAANRVATSPQRLQQLVARLNDADPSARAETLRTLRRLGPAATAEILHTFTDQGRRAEFPDLRRALQLMGDDAIAPLLGGARADYLQVQAESVRALGSYRTLEACNTLMRSCLSPQLPESLRRIALESLIQSGRTPADPNLVESRFYQQAMDLLVDRQKLNAGPLDEVTLWNWDVATKRLVPTQVSTATATRISAAQIAADLYEIRPDSPQNRLLRLLTHLESSKLASGPSLSMEASTFFQSFGDVKAGELEQILSEALKLGLIPAATACCELLGQLGTEDLVYGTAEKPRPLVEAMLVGDRYLQFAALEAIKKLNPQQPYFGSSYVLSIAVFLASSDNREAGLIGDHRIDTAQTYAALMSTQQIVGIAATTGQDLFTHATRNPDLELIVISDNLQTPYYMELIQQLRNDMRTKRIPIALLVRDSENHARLQQINSNDPLFTYLPMSLDPESVSKQIGRIKKLATPWSVALLDRQQHAQVAVDWLTLIASDRNRYRFYDLASRQPELTQILYRPGLAESGTQILKSLGTPAAQRELLNFISQSNHSLEDRRIAARAFADLVKTKGAQLTREDVLRQYDRYNASSLESVETQELLGAILDALERKSVKIDKE
jgi:CheY-like chemotaxis protein